MGEVHSLRRAPRSTAGMTMLEVLIAVFVFGVGIVGVLAALPVGVSSAKTVIFQDAAIHLSQSKFAEFRRDRINPATDLSGGSAYMTSNQEPLNSTGVFRDFAHNPGEAYQYFDDIDRYEWMVEVSNAGAGPATDPAALVDYLAPVTGAAGSSRLRMVKVTIHLKSATPSFSFSQLMTAYD